MSDDAPEIIPPHHSPVRSIWAEGHDLPYHAFTSLEEAWRNADAAVVMEGDDGGQIYLTCPVACLRCNHDTLTALLEDLNSLAWGDGEGLYYEVLPPGSAVGGGMGGGLVLDHVWLHQDFQEMWLRAEVEQVIAGMRPRLSTEALEQAKRLSQEYSWAQREDQIVDLDWNRISRSGWTCTHCGVAGVGGKDFRLYHRRPGTRYRKFVLCNHCHLPQRLSLFRYTPCPSCGQSLKSSVIRQCYHCGAEWDPT